MFKNVTYWGDANMYLDQRMVSLTKEKFCNTVLGIIKLKLFHFFPDCILFRRSTRARDQGGEANGRGLVHLHRGELHRTGHGLGLPRGQHGLRKLGPNERAFHSAGKNILFNLIHCPVICLF
jgi:hypothetical protein